MISTFIHSFPCYLLVPSLTPHADSALLTLSNTVPPTLPYRHSHFFLYPPQDLPFDFILTQYSFSHIISPVAVFLGFDSYAAHNLFCCSLLTQNLQRRTLLYSLISFVIIPGTYTDSALFFYVMIEWVTLLFAVKCNMIAV